ncbi:MAG: hypothetical protein V3V20_06545 [Algisphaera sp.]
MQTQKTRLVNMLWVGGFLFAACVLVLIFSLVHPNPRQIPGNIKITIAYAELLWEELNRADSIIGKEALIDISKGVDILEVIPPESINDLNDMAAAVYLIKDDKSQGPVYLIRNIDLGSGYKVDKHGIHFVPPAEVKSQIKSTNGVAVYLVD